MASTSIRPKSPAVGVIIFSGNSLAGILGATLAIYLIQKFPVLGRHGISEGNRKVLSNFLMLL